MIKIIEKFSYWKDSLFLFIKNDGTVIKVRKSLGKIHPYLYNNFYKIFGKLFGLLFVFIIFYGIFWRAPFNFAPHSIIVVEKGESLSSIANDLNDNHFVVSSLWFKFFISIVGGQRQIIAGEYYFEEPVNVFTVSFRLLRGHFGFNQIRVYIPEGLNSKEMADVIALALPRFDKAGFIDLAKVNEGYLFPDTYFFTPNTKLPDIVSLMRENFARQTNSLADDITKSGRSLEDIIKVASIVQDEAGGMTDKRIVAGIIWKRIKFGMPLQTDSTLRYINGKTSGQLTKDELSDKNNPYNTYANKGLPPTPISNPGLDAIRAAIAPTNTDYLYFLSDSHGGMHYAKDFEGHKRNREAYL